MFHPLLHYSTSCLLRVDLSSGPLLAFSSTAHFQTSVDESAWVGDDRIPGQFPQLAVGSLAMLRAIVSFDSHNSGIICEATAIDRPDSLTFTFVFSERSKEVDFDLMFLVRHGGRGTTCLQFGQACLWH